MAITYERKPLAWAILPPNIRGDLGDEAELRRLGRSYLKNPIHLLIAALDGTVLDGSRRIKGLLLEGATEADFAITDEEPTAERLAEIQLISTVHRRGLTDYDVWKAVAHCAASHPEWSKRQLAEHLDLDAPDITKILAASGCIPEAQEAFRLGRVGKTDMYAFSKAEGREEQARLLVRRLNGATRDQIEKARRERPNGSAQVARTARIRCPLASGQTVTVAGAEISLEESIEALREALKAMVKARDAGLDARTAQAVWKDMAVAGG